MGMPRVVKKKCLICNKKFNRYAKRKKGRRMTHIRQSRAVTCCKNCSKELMHKGGSKKWKKTKKMNLSTKILATKIEILATTVN